MGKGQKERERGAEREGEKGGREGREREAREKAIKDRVSGVFFWRGGGGGFRLKPHIEVRFK